MKKTAAKKASKAAPEQIDDGRILSGSVVFVRWDESSPPKLGVLTRWATSRSGEGERPVVRLLRVDRNGYTGEVAGERMFEPGDISRVYSESDLARSRTIKTLVEPRNPILLGKATITRIDPVETETTGLSDGDEIQVRVGRHWEVCVVVSVDDDGITFNSPIDGTEGFRHLVDEGKDWRRYVPTATPAVSPPTAPVVSEQDKKTARGVERQRKKVERQGAGAVREAAGVPVNPKNPTPIERAAAKARKEEPAKRQRKVETRQADDEERARQVDNDPGHAARSATMGDVINQIHQLNGIQMVPGGVIEIDAEDEAPPWA